MPTLEELAKILNGKLSDCDYLPGPNIIGIASIADAKEGYITFLNDTKNLQKNLAELAKSKASAVITSEKIGKLSLPSIRFKSAYDGLKRALEYFYPQAVHQPIIHPTAFIHEDAKIAKNVYIGPHTVVEEGATIEEGCVIEALCYIGRNVQIGAGTRIYSNVTVNDRCTIGKNCIIHSGCVIGSDGFGFFFEDGFHKKIPQVGIVEIHDNVEIGANVTIDRATMGKTIIGEGTKIDNLVHIAHNVHIGKNCIIVAQVGISGSTVIEDNVTLAGQVGTVGHVRIGKGSTIAARGVVTDDVKPNQIMSGFPIKPHSEEKRIMASLPKLPELIKKITNIENIIKNILQKVIDSNDNQKS